MCIYLQYEELGFSKCQYNNFVMENARAVSVRPMETDDSKLLMEQNRKLLCINSPGITASSPVSSCAGKFIFRRRSGM